MKTLREYANSNLRQKKAFLSNIIGHKIDEILDSPSGYQNPNEYIARFRHEECAYSTAHIFQTDSGLRVALENFETNKLEYLN